MALSFLDQYFTFEAVLKILIRLRCKEAEKIQQHLVVDCIAVSNGRRMERPESKRELYDMFPPRRQWVHLGMAARKDLTQAEKWQKSLWLTVMRERQREGRHSDWYTMLEERIAHILIAARTGKHIFDHPNVTVIEKKRNEQKKEIECRPICLFKTIDERIIASLYNKALTALFDPLFYEHSYAFRIFKEGDESMSHLNAVRKIKEFRAAHCGILWVAECDMKKFYDTIDHDVIKQRFMQLLLKQKQAGIISCEEFHILRRTMFSYIDCFSFHKHVFSFNRKPAHPIWKHIENANGYKKVIKWIEEDIKEKRNGKWPYRTKLHDRYQLGVPQGGALSGLIANVIMHFTDMRLKKYWQNDNDFLYVRFCDDMIMMSSDKGKIDEATKCYTESIEKSHLYMHPDVPFTDRHMSKFWDGKTRLSYQWGEPAENVFPWITFVGYDYNWEGHTRIRKASVKKEIKKQYEKRIEIEHLLGAKGDRQPQWARQYIRNSVHKRMIGMSVGRVQMWNYTNFGNDYSWAKAFTQLTDNPWARGQLKGLDRHRNLMMKRLWKFLLPLDYSARKPSDRKANNKALWYFGKPFSYYGQALKAWKPVMATQS